MSRQWFGSWGAELSEEEFACALAGGITSLLGKKDRVAWTGDLLAFAKEAPNHDAKGAAQRWRAQVSPTDAVAIEVSTTRVDADPAWLVSTLRRADGVAAVAFLDERGRAVSRRWDWPVDVGYLGDAASAQLRDRLSKDPLWGLVRHVDVATARSQIDLLLFPGTLAEALATFALSQRPPEIHTVLALGGVGQSRDVLHALGALRTEASAAVAGVLDIPAEKQAAWFAALVRELAHDRTLDRALFSAGFAPLLLAQPNALAASHAARVAGDVLESFRPKKNGGLESFNPSPSPMPMPPGFQDFASHYNDGKLDWKRELDAATTLKDLKHAKPPDKPVGRYVKGQIQQAGKRIDTPLEPGVVYALAIAIGAPSAGWATSTAAFPTHLLPRDEKGHQLTVVLVAPSLFAQPQSTSLWLPAVTDSDPCLFHFVPPVGATEIEARVTVLYENRILQTLVVKAPIAGHAPAGATLTIQPETVLRCNLDDLGGRPGFDAAFFLNSMEGKRGLTAFGTNAAYLEFDDSLKDLIKELRTELEKITRDPDNYATLKSEQSRLLIVTLARLGFSFGTSLRELAGGAVSGLGAGPGRIQIASIHPDALVPIEYIYDRAFPDDTATLCAAVLSGTPCTAACANDHSTVCPQGFWGMRHVVERRLWDDHVKETLRANNADHVIAPEASQHGSTLGRVTSVLLGTADRAANFNKAAFDSAIAEVDAIAKEDKIGLCSVSSWQAWVHEIATTHPQVLMLVTHTDKKAGSAILELGAADHLDAPKLLAPFVCQPPAQHPAPGPIVMLLGCRSALPEVPFASFVSAFRRAGASVVIATLSTVRGRHMGPLASEAMKLLLACQRRPSCSVGELVRDLRASALMKDLPVGLALVAYGEADWQLAAST